MKKILRNFLKSGLKNTRRFDILTKPEKKTDDGNTTRIVLPFKDQIAANAVRGQLNNKNAVTLQAIFSKILSRKN